MHLRSLHTDVYALYVSSLLRLLFLLSLLLLLLPAGPSPTKRHELLPLHVRSFKQSTSARACSRTQDWVTCHLPSWNHSSTVLLLGSSALPWLQRPFQLA